MKIRVLTSLTVKNLSVTAVVSPHMQISNLRMKILLTLEIQGQLKIAGSLASLAQWIEHQLCGFFQLLAIQLLVRPCSFGDIFEVLHHKYDDSHDCLVCARHETKCLHMPFIYLILITL